MKIDIHIYNSVLQMRVEYLSEKFILDEWPMTYNYRQY